jgi:hypothetical protein
VSRCAPRLGADSLAKGDPLLDSAVIVRRFDPTDEHHWTTDEEGLPPQLRQSAFRFDREHEADTHLGCSVFEEKKLTALGLTKWDCIEGDRPVFRVALATVERVRGVSRAGMTERPFDSVEDALVSDHKRDKAHALITHPGALSKPAKWYRELARVFTPELSRGS